MPELHAMPASILQQYTSREVIMKASYILREGIIHIRKIVGLLRKRGIFFVIRLLVTVVCGYYFYRIFKSNRVFLFQEKEYKYFYHHYNVTWTSERSVEIPIIRSVLGRCKNKRVLEVGNILSHYFPTSHDILDKYEEGKNVINQDVVDFQPTKKYDLIVSISTLEHIGWDEHLLYRTREPQKTLRAFDNPKKCLTHNGEMWVTFPVGYNPHLDQMIDAGKIAFTKLLCMKRISADNAWVEAKWRDVSNAQYDNPFISANGLAVGYFKNTHNNGRRVDQ
jgi:hypothetical protein